MLTYYYYGGTLYHHGIKGQKWGLRRFQNEDGSLTAAGREHYGYGEVKVAYKKRLSDADTTWKKKSDNLEKEYFRRLEGIEKNYKRGQMLSEKDQKRESELDEWWDKEQKKLNSDRDLEKKNAKSDFKNSDEYKARQEKIKKAAKIGLAVAGTALAVYGAYKVSEAIKDKNRIEAGKRAAMNLYNANAPATTYARQSKLDGKVYYKMKDVYGNTIQKGSAKDLDSYRKIVSDRQWEATQQHAKAIRDLQAKKRK